MLETYSSLTIEDLGNMTSRKYTSLLSQIPNILNYKAGGSLQRETARERIARKKKIIAERLLNGKA